MARQTLSRKPFYAFLRKGYNGHRSPNIALALFVAGPLLWYNRNVLCSKKSIYSRRPMSQLGFELTQDSKK